MDTPILTPGIRLCPCPTPATPHARPLHRPLCAGGCGTRTSHEPGSQVCQDAAAERTWMREDR